jgi:mono/diheme cytochrome c family protein
MKAVGVGLILTLLVLGLLPFALIARSRASPNENQPVHLVLDMDKQPKFKAQRATPMFADNRAMRPEIPGTLAQEDLMVTGETLNDRMGTRPILLSGDKTSILLDNPTIYAAVMLGRNRPPAMSDREFADARAKNANDNEIKNDTFYVAKIPDAFKIDQDTLRRGQERFTIYCAPCHGESGYGDGPVANRAKMLQTTPDAVNGWAAPQNLNEQKIIDRPDGNIFNTISNGVRNMPAYDKQIEVTDRWYIVAYVRALERSQNARPEDVPAGK